MTGLDLGLVLTEWGVVLTLAVFVGSLLPRAFDLYRAAVASGEAADAELAERWWAGLSYLSAGSVLGTLLIAIITFLAHDDSVAEFRPNWWVGAGVVVGAPLVLHLAFLLVLGTLLPRMPAKPQAATAGNA